MARAGNRGEHVELVVGDRAGRLWLEHDLDPARVIDDLALEVWVKSNRAGAALGVRVILPNHRDPKTKAVLSTFIGGTVYADEGRWQRLECRDIATKLRTRLRQLRWQLDDPTISDRDAYVDRVVLQSDLEEGAVEYFVDDLRFGPIVDPRRAREGEVVPVAASDAKTSPIEFRLDQLRVDGQPFFPRFTPYHGEDVEELATIGLNTALVPRYEDVELLGRLRCAGLWAMATPPRALGSDGVGLDRSTASLLPFGPEADPILLWLAGTRVPVDRRDEVTTWTSQVRAADPLGRPMMADVAGDERAFSRSVRMLGTSRHFLNGTLSTIGYHDWLLERRSRAWPGTFLWTWIQTEPAAVHVESRRLAGQNPVVLEPEQLRLQVYSALSAGCRGIGFWKTTPLTGNRIGDDERRLAIRQLNLELQLLEPLLATANRAGSVPFSVARQSREVTRGDIDFLGNRGTAKRENLLRSLAQQRRNESIAEERFDAAVLGTSGGLLLLPVWHERGSQYVPGQLAANDASILLTGASETATAWEITTTSIRSLGRGEPVAGGRQIIVPKFDQTAAILVTSDQRVVEDLRRRVDEIRERSSEIAVALAKAKFTRVERTLTELRELGQVQPDAPQLLSRAAQLIERADIVHRAGSHDAARELARNAMQVLRILQRADWEDAVEILASPASTPHTLCHHTLPDYWRMIERIGRSPHVDGENLLRSGDFEDLDTMLVEGWRHEQRDLPGVSSSADLDPHGREGRYALRMVVAAPARREGAPLPVSPDRPIVVRTPAISLAGGQMVHISGWYRHRPEGPEHVDGPVVYDDVLGSATALRLTKIASEADRNGWRRFEMIREVQGSRDVTVTFAMNGYGELHLDDVRIVSLDERAARQATPATPQRLLPGNPLNLINRIPGFGR